MHIGQRVQKSMDIVDKVVYYLYENNQPYFGQIVKSAASEVLAHENGAIRKHRYNKQTNSTLCEALIEMNYHKDCPQNYRSVVSKLIEAYRVMNGMPGDDFEYAEEMKGPDSFGDFTVEVQETEASPDTIEEFDEIDGTFVEDRESAQEYILDNTEIGAEYHINDIMEDTTDKLNFIGAQDTTITVLKSLIKMGYFEVIERDEFNGKPAVVQRIR